ncbi:myb family DNA-binding domain containing protein [Entamoeba histolytica HM-3:IMSS]|uniref:Myb-like DNA-binding domain containing protein n=4 Tax=Entamoeba histolytica TaxID=5759 RepID=C4LYG1_ENTH1|nr:myb-like DNA-binding domain containing protein [Entamoeba histolytica HM-1:IMSS]XP_657302.1 myb-like DNA-binding domain containing protein [Entamoeba histolytica HM-1:IMSS]EMD47969.1 myb family DNAbinding domain containing protein [Entamoeba histolytica KU27]EMS14520.1 myb family DNA-binding domain containing protein [Entamoeba histolytica HM-3:IMSS]GAT93857.1 myb-like DNA-binding domain containing protein [Entamoeba histolytica]EAL42538.1 myb-like DNA-binding domain containing protein [Ent|eukprot:XP_647924.1 myb-like DNA-binding domain containing protein [Entamoeba histolytica HM-1:IMSS]
MQMSVEMNEIESLVCESGNEEKRNEEKERKGRKERRQGKMWTNEEDNKLMRGVERYGESKWVEISKEVGSRTRKQCRERYINHLKPSIDTSQWKREEDEIILQQHSVFGSHWCSIAMYLNNRTARSIRNRYYSLINKKSNSSCFKPSTMTHYKILTSSSWF